MIAGIIFDKDGTLFDFRRTWGDWSRRLIAGLAGDDAEQARALANTIGFDLETGAFHEDSLVIGHTPLEIGEAMVPLLPGWGLEELVSYMNRQAEVVDLAPTIPLAPYLDGLRGRGLRLGVVTNDAEAPARAHLGLAGVTGHFDFIAGSDSGHGGKPVPGQLLAFCAAVGLMPAQVVMVGDSLHDLKAGTAAGMRRVGVLTGIAGAEELAPEADAVLPDIGHLPGWLDAQAGA